MLSTKPGLADIRQTPIETFMSSKVVCVAFMVANGHCPCGRAAFFDRNSLLFVHSISFLRPHGALLAQKMHLCILKDPYNNAGAHGFSLLYHRLRSEDGGLDTKFFLGILGTSFPEPYLAMKAAEHQT